MTFNTLVSCVSSTIYIVAIQTTPNNSNTKLNMWTSNDIFEMLESVSSYLRDANFFSKMTNNFYSSFSRISLEVSENKNKSNIK